MTTLMKPTPRDQRQLNLTPQIKLPKDRYTLRIKDEEFKISGAKDEGAGNNPMLVLKFEFIAPDSFKGPNNETVNIAGIEVVKAMYLVLSVNGPGGVKDEEKSQKAFDRYCDLLTKLGIEVPAEGIDVNNPPRLLKGKIVDAICDAEEFEQRKDQTPEQKAQGKPGDLITDSEGKPIKAYFTNVVTILGLGDASLASNKPF